MNFTVLATSKKLCCQAAADDQSRNKSAARLHVIHSESPEEAASAAGHVGMRPQKNPLLVTPSVFSAVVPQQQNS